MTASLPRDVDTGACRFCRWRMPSSWPWMPWSSPIPHRFVPVKSCIPVWRSTPHPFNAGSGMHRPVGRVKYIRQATLWKPISRRSHPAQPMACRGKRTAGAGRKCCRIERKGKPYRAATVRERRDADVGVLRKTASLRARLG